MTLDFQMLKELDSARASFEVAGVRYALAGGFAVSVYGHIRATKDVDFLCHPDDLGLTAARLAELGYKAFAEPWTVPNTGMRLHRFMKGSAEPELFHVIDLLIPPAERLYWIHQAEQLRWGEAERVRVVSREHLIEMKKLRGSAQDQADIAHLGEEA